MSKTVIKKQEAYNNKVFAMIDKIVIDAGFEPTIDNIPIAVLELAIKDNTDELYNIINYTLEKGATSILDSPVLKVYNFEYVLYYTSDEYAEEDFEYSDYGIAKLLYGDKFTIFLLSMILFLNLEEGKYSKLFQEYKALIEVDGAIYSDVYGRGSIEDNLTITLNTRELILFLIGEDVYDFKLYADECGSNSKYRYTIPFYLDGLTIEEVQSSDLFRFIPILLNYIDEISKSNEIYNYIKNISKCEHSTLNNFLLPKVPHSILLEWFGEGIKSVIYELGKRGETSYEILKQLNTREARERLREMEENKRKVKGAINVK